MIFKKIERGVATKPSPALLRARTKALVEYVVNAPPGLIEELGLSDDRSHQLTSYIVGQVAGTPGEKVLATGKRALLGNDLLSWQAQMAATLACGKKSKDPLEHYVLSWHPHEQPTVQQAEEAVEMLLKELGLEECQAVWAMHGNTANLHVHVAVSRVHPVTHRVLRADKGLDKLVGLQAIALIEAKQGWQPERGAVYELNKQGEVVRKKDGKVVRHPNGTRPHRWSERGAEKLDLRHPLNALSDGARRKEQETGLASPHRIAIREAAYILETARNWSELHRDLAARGISFRRKGSGAVLRIGNVEISASKAGRKCSLHALEKRERLGPYEMPPPDLAVKGRGLGVRHTKGTRYVEYNAVKKTYQELVRDMAQTRAGQYGGSDPTTSGLGIARHQGKRPRGRPRAPHFPSFDEWLNGAAVPDIGGLVAIIAASEPAPAPAGLVNDDLDDFVGRVGTNGWTEYRRRHGTDAGRPAFVDAGARILVYASDDEQALLAALRLGAAKSPEGLRLYGSAAFVRTCMTLAAKHEIRLADPALQKVVESIRSELAAEQVAKQPRVTGRTSGDLSASDGEAQEAVTMRPQSDITPTGGGQTHDQDERIQRSASKHGDQPTRTHRRQDLGHDGAPPADQEIQLQADKREGVASDDGPHIALTALDAFRQHPLIAEWLRLRKQKPQMFRVQRELASDICKDPAALKLVQAVANGDGPDQALAKTILNQSSAHRSSPEPRVGREVG